MLSFSISVIIQLVKGAIPMAEMTRTVKDSVFTYLFRQPEYTRQLYLSLHPEDTDVTEAAANW